MSEQTAPASAGQVERPVRPYAWMTREAAHRLKNGGNSKGAVPVHGKPSVAAKIPLYDQTALDAAASSKRPYGWRLERDRDRIIVTMPDGGGCVAHKVAVDGRMIPEEVLFALCEALGA